MNTINDELLRLNGNPSSIQYRMLRGLEQELGGSRVITTPCNVASFLIEGFAVNSANIVQSITENLIQLSPNQAQTSEELYKHLSDKDWAGIYGNPSSTFIELSFLVETIKDCAIPPLSSVEAGDFLYSKVVIPRYSEFTIGGKIFSTYYPIEIRVSSIGSGTDNKSLGIVVLYDTSSINPLYSLSNPTLEHRLTTYGGQSTLTLKIPVFQFSRKKTIHEIFPGKPFEAVIPFTDKLYAVRAYTSKDYETGEVDTYTDNNGVLWTELGQVLDTDVYDSDISVIPSVVLYPNIEQNTLRLKVPQVFLTENRLGNKISIEVFTTAGEIEVSVDTSTEVPGMFPFELSAEQREYSKVLLRTENIHAFPLEERVVGGTNGLSFSEIRNRALYNTHHIGTINSPSELEHLLSYNGFTVTRFKDGLTRRIYLCNKTLTLDNVVVPSGVLITNIMQEEGDELPKGIYRHTSDFGDVRKSYTITPQAIFEYDEYSGTCSPTTNLTVYGEDYLSVNGATAEDLALILNNNDVVYTFSPFYTQVNTIANVTIATTYDLSNPEIESWTVSDTATATLEVLYLTGAQIDHDPTNTENQLKLTVSFEINPDPSQMEAVDVVDISLTFPKGSWTVTNSVAIAPDEVGGSYSLDLYTEYELREDNYLVAYYQVDEVVNTLYLPLDGSITCHIKDSANATVSTEYNLHLVLGDRIEQLMGSVDVTTIDGEPQLYTANVPATYDNTYYKVYVDAMNKVQLEVDDTRTKGAPILDEDGDPVYLHKKGDPVLDENGNPTYSERKMKYCLNMIHIASKIKYQPRRWPMENESTINVLQSTIRGHCAQLETLQDRLLEGTEVYYQPRRSFGKALCWGTTSYPKYYNLEISIALRLHIVRRLQSELQYGSRSAESTLDSIREDVIVMVDEMLSKGYCSLVELGKQITTQFTGLVTSVDLLGINGDSNLQTLKPVDKEVNLSLKTEVIAESKSVLSTDRALRIEFVNTSGVV